MLKRFSKRNSSKSPVSLLSNTSNTTNQPQVPAQSSSSNTGSGVIPPANNGGASQPPDTKGAVKKAGKSETQQSPSATLGAAGQPTIPSSTTTSSLSESKEVVKPETKPPASSSTSSASSVAETKRVTKPETKQPASSSSPLSLPDAKQADASSSLSYQITLKAAMSLEDYFKNTTLKPTPGLLFKDVLPFQPLTPATLVNEEVDNLAELAMRLRDLRRTVLHDLAQLNASEDPVLAEAKGTEAKETKAAIPATLRQRRLSQQAVGTRWTQFKGTSQDTLAAAVDKAQLADQLSRLNSDERLEVLAMLSELQQQLQHYEQERAQTRQRAHQFWVQARAALRFGAFSAAQQAKNAAAGRADDQQTVVTSDATIRKNVTTASDYYEAALLAHDRRQGWAKLAPPVGAADAKEREAKETKETKESKEVAVAEQTSSDPKAAVETQARLIPPAFVQLRENLAHWLGIKSGSSVAAMRERLFAIQDYCQLAHRLSECSVHLQHDTQLARRVVADFKTHAFKDDPELMQAICQLAVAQDPELLRALLGTLIDSIQSSSLLQVHILQGLATVLTHSRAEDVSLGDLHTILKLVVERTDRIGSDLSDTDALQLLQALGALLSLMALISQQRTAALAAKATVGASHARDKAFKVDQQATGPVGMGHARDKAPSFLARAKGYFQAKADAVKTLVDIDGPAEDSGIAVLSEREYEALANRLQEKVIGSVQARYGEELQQKNPELYFAVIVIRQALMRISKRERPRSEKIINGMLQFVAMLETAKDAITGLSPLALIDAGSQLVDFVGATPLGQKAKALFASEEERAQPWFEQFLVLKTLLDSDQLPQLEIALIQQQHSALSYPLCLGALQLLDSVVRTDSRSEVRKAAIQLLQLLASNVPSQRLWQWPTTPEFTALQQRLQAKCDKEYANDKQLTLDQRRLQQSYQRAQQHSQQALRTARRHCQESDLRFQLHDYCLSQTRQAHQDTQWVQDNHRYIPALAKPRFDVTDDNAQLFYPQFEAFRQSSRAAETKDSKASPSSSKAQRALLIMGDAGTGKSLFLRRDHLTACARYISRQFDQSSDTATALGNPNYPLSFHLYLNQSPVERPLEHHLQQQGFTEDHIRQLKDQGQVLIHLDGYDEWSTQGQNPWVFGPKTLGSWVSSRCQVIVACRSQHLQGAKDYKDYFTPPRQDAGSPANARDAGALSEWIITCLDEGGVAQLTAYYVQDEQAQGHSPWSQEKYLRQFQDSSIQSLVRTPIILLMALQVLPTLQKRMADNAQILRLDIYREFISQYLQTQRSKHLTRGTPHLAGVIEAAEDYAQALALALFSQEKAAVSYQPKPRFSFAPHQDDPWARFFSDASPDQLLSTLIPLRINAQRNLQDASTITQFSFTHKSLLDYFTALGLYQEIEELASQLEETPPPAPTSTLSATSQSTLPWLLAGGSQATTDPALFLNLAIEWEAAERYAKAQHDWQTRHQQRLIASPLSRRAVSSERSVITFIDEILQDHSRRWEAEYAAATEPSSGETIKEGKGTKEAKATQVTLSQALSTLPPASATLHPRKQFKARLTKIILASCDYPELAQAAGNAVTLLAACHYLFLNEAWHGVRIKGANLMGSYWSAMDLSSAEFTDCHLAASWWQNCDLQGVRFSGTRWGEFPSVLSKDEIYAMAINPVDPNQLAITSDSEILLYDRAQGRVTHTLGGHEGKITCLQYAPNGHQLASGGVDKTVRLWDPRGGEQQAPITLRGHEEGSICCLQYAPDGHQLASGGGGGEDIATVRLWDPRGGEQQASVTLRGHKGSVFCLRYAPDGHQLASGSRDATVHLWNPRGGEQQIPLTLRGHGDNVLCLQYAPDGHQLASGSRDDTVRLWDPRGGEQQTSLTLRHEGVTCLQYAPDGHQLASGSGNKTVRLWDPRGGEQQIPRTLCGHENGVTCLQYAPDGHQLASGSVDETVRLWDPRGGEQQIPLTLRGHKGELICLQYTPDGYQLASGSRDATVHLWDPRGGEQQIPLTLRGHGDKVLCLQYAPGGHQLASGSRDKTVRLWNPRGGEQQAPVMLRGHEGNVACLQYAPDGRQLASGGGDKTVRLWDPRAGEQQAPRTLRGHEGSVACLQYAPDGHQLASGSGDKTVRLWNPRGGEQQAPRTLRGHNDDVMCLQYAPDGHQLATGSWDAMVRLWNPRGGEQQTPLTLSKHWNGIRCLQYAPDGHQLASVSGEATVFLWDPRGGEQQAPLELGGGYVECLQYAPDGHQLAFGNFDGTVRLWDPRVGVQQVPLMLRGHERSVACLQYAPDGHQLASGSADATVRLWDPKTGSCLQVIPWVEAITALCWGRIEEKPALFMGTETGAVVAFIQGYQGFRLQWVRGDARLPSLSFHGCKLSGALLPPSEQRLLEQRGGSFKEEEVVLESKAALKALPQSSTELVAETPVVETKQSASSSSSTTTTVGAGHARDKAQPSAGGMFAGTNRGMAETLPGAGSTRDIGSSPVGAGHARDKAPADTKAQRLLTELQATVDQLYPVDKPGAASQRAAYLVKLQPYSSREANLTIADRVGLRLLKGELEDVQEALSVSTPVLTS